MVWYHTSARMCGEWSLSLHTSSDKVGIGFWTSGSDGVVPVSQVLLGPVRSEVLCSVCTSSILLCWFLLCLVEIWFVWGFRSIRMHHTQKLINHLNHKRRYDSTTSPGPTTSRPFTRELDTGGSFRSDLENLFGRKTQRESTNRQGKFESINLSLSESLTSKSSFFLHGHWSND